MIMMIEDTSLGDEINGSYMDAIHTDVFSLPMDERGDVILGFIAFPACRLDCVDLSTGLCVPGNSIPTLR